MKPKGRVFIPTSVFNKAYLKRAWAERGALANYERRGFAQFFYLTISGHFEALIAEIIKARLRSIRTMLPWDQVGQTEYTRDGEKHSCSLQPLVSSLFALLDSSEMTAEQVSFEPLRKLYSQIFARSLADAIGPELEQDINALFRLRNIFAHSRQLCVDLEGLPGDIDSMTLKDNPFLFPAQRLQRTGIINSLAITPQNYNEFQEHFYSDQALLHFYNRVIEAEHKLTGQSDFMPETGSISMHILELPNLQAEQTDGAEQADAPPASTS